MITTFDITFDSNVDEVCRAATKADLDTKSWNELVWSFEAISRWGDQLRKRFGSLVRIDHRSPPDDPPDLLLHFDRCKVALEHTLLKPYPLGWAEAIRGHRGGFVPPVGTRRWTRKELTDVISGADATWADALDMYEATRNALSAAIDEKVKRLPDGGIIVIDDRATFDGRERERMIREILARSRHFQDCTVLFFQRNNSLQFWSALLTADELLIRVSDS
jgi:hypothetical protein